MPAPKADETAEREKHKRLVQQALARGQAALAAGDRADATRWLERAHRLAPTDGTITLILASGAIGSDNLRAAALFAEALTIGDARDARFGLATALFLSGDMVGACSAVAEALGRHAVWPDITGLAGQVVKATHAPGWCGLTSEGIVVVQPNMDGEIAVFMSAVGPAVRRHGEARKIERAAHRNEWVLPACWPRWGSVAVTIGGRHLVGSPISLRAIGLVEGYAEPTADGIRGWVWCPGDADAELRLTVGSGRQRKEIVASEPADQIPGLAPLARPRRFAIPWPDLPGEHGPVRLRGRDGRDLQGSPVIERHAGGGSKPKAPSAGTPRSSARAELARWGGGETASVVLITHDDGGGVERRVQTSVASHEARGRRAIVLRPSQSPDGTAGVVAAGNALPELRFEMPRELPALLRLLRGTRPAEAELHHFLNHDPSVFEIIPALAVPYDVHTHDYAWFCPRVALVGGGNRYCGEPAPAACEVCVSRAGSYLNEDISVSALLARSRNVLMGARRIIAPSHDAAERMTRHFPGIVPVVIPHEDDDAVDDPPPVPNVAGTVRVCVAGGIGLHKGFQVLLACARDARKRALDLEFIVVGMTIDDQSLMDTGRAFVTGPYQPDEAVALIRAQDAALALLPSIWPETWCLGLTELWRAGLRVAAFDTGAPAERIRRTGRGFLLPLGIPARAINDALLNAARGRSFLPVRRSSAYKPSHRCNPE